MVDIAETDAHDVWICVDHVRSFHPEMPKNKDLTVTYRRSMFYVKDGGRHFISESGLRSLIQTTAKSHQHVDALRFLDWFDRNITQVAVKKRTERDRVESIAQQDAQDKLASDGMQPIELAHSPLRERLVSQCNDLENTAASFWHGERNIVLTFVMGLLAGYTPMFLWESVLSDDQDWAGSYLPVLWWNLSALLLAFSCALWFGVSMKRSLKTSFQKPGSFIWTLTFYLFTFSTIFSIGRARSAQTIPAIRLQKT